MVRPSNIQLQPNSRTENDAKLERETKKHKQTNTNITNIQAYKHTTILWKTTINCFGHPPPYLYLTLKLLMIPCKQTNKYKDTKIQVYKHTNVLCKTTTINCFGHSAPYLYLTLRLLMIPCGKIYSYNIRTYKYKCANIQTHKHKRNKNLFSFELLSFVSGHPVPYLVLTL